MPRITPYRCQEFTPGGGNNPFVPNLANVGEYVIVYGWTYHNEADGSAYAKLHNSGPFSFNLSAPPMIRVGLPPQQSTGHVCSRAGIMFANGLGISLESRMDEAVWVPVPDYTVHFAVFYLTEADF